MILAPLLLLVAAQAEPLKLIDEVPKISSSPTEAVSRCKNDRFAEGKAFEEKLNATAKALAMSQTQPAKMTGGMSRDDAALMQQLGSVTMTRKPEVWYQPSRDAQQALEDKLKDINQKRATAEEGCREVVYGESHIKEPGCISAAHSAWQTQRRAAITASLKDLQSLHEQARSAVKAWAVPVDGLAVKAASAKAGFVQVQANSLRPMILGDVGTLLQLSTDANCTAAREWEKTDDGAK